MTAGEGVGVLLIVLGLLYALVYVGWLRRSRQDPPVGAGAESAPGHVEGPDRPSATRPPPALVLAWAQGKHIGNVTTSSRHERVASAKLAVRTRATMVVDDSLVRWDCEGPGEARVPGTRLLDVGLARDLAGRPMSRTPIVRVSWQDDNGDRQVTAFLPRRRADCATLVSAVRRLMSIGASSQGTPESEGGPQSQVQAAATADRSR